MCFIFESCVDFFCLGSWGWSTWNVTRKPYVTRCRKVLRACWAICWLGHLLEVLLEEMTPNHNRIASARQCILLILLFYQWNQILSCCDGLKSGTKPDIPKKWLTFEFGNCHAAFVLSQQCLGNQPDGKPVVAQQNGLLKKISPCHTMSVLWKTYVHVFYFQDYGHV